MAEKPYTIKKLVKDVEPDQVSAILISWEGLANGDYGTPYECWMHSDKSIQVAGVFGTGGKCVIQGSNKETNPVWTTLSNNQGNLLEFTASKIDFIAENCFQIRPNITDGDSNTNLNIYIIMK